MAPQLNDALLIPGELHFASLADGYPVIQVTHAHASATVALHGAHVTAFEPAGQAPVIFTSKEAVYKEGKAIRGGIPVCWPWFNAHPSNPELPSHGVARSRFWILSQTSTNPEYTELVFELPAEASAEFGLTAQLSIRVGRSLDLALTATNVSDQDVPVGGALHSYFKVSDVDAVRLLGFDDEHFIDTTNETMHQQHGEIHIQSEVDRIYDHGDSPITLQDAALKRDITIRNGGSGTTVVWNPWTEKAAALGDLADAEFHDFVCIEAANARHDTRMLAPGESHTLSTSITSTPHS
ncbi:D-hexose-6-phosphate mutarotase [Rubritalea marina]|uniref:D-hexose-6-phosphate mutarotase n=1 Tax=Rubritalea marina TaxID=361055 RepID=UPI00036F250B|nr:D-hexose-6-phosphate mutarotase [Rubritalea marina]